MDNIVEVEDVILGYEYENGGIWRIWEFYHVEFDGNDYSEEWRELLCEMPLYNPNNDNAESEEKHINENANLIVRALNAIHG